MLISINELLIGPSPSQHSWVGGFLRSLNQSFWNSQPISIPSLIVDVIMVCP